MLKIEKLSWDELKNIVGKGKNAGDQHFLLFPQCLQSFLFQGHLMLGFCGKYAIDYTFVFYADAKSLFRFAMVDAEDIGNGLCDCRLFDIPSTDLNKDFVSYFYILVCLISFLT